MLKDRIVEEVRAARDAYAKQFDYDLKKIGADLRKKSRARKASSETQPVKTPTKATKPKKTRRVASAPAKRRPAA